MTVLHEIFDWSQGLPAWQRDALRRLVLNGELSDDDIVTLTEICKSAQGLAEQQTIAPLTKAHLPNEATSTTSISLVSIFHHKGVNALAEDQTLKFSPNLTVVYGDNAAGKTGYIRILKSACHSRGREAILGNVTSNTTLHLQDVSIKYRTNAQAEPQEWIDNNNDDSISRVSVFDTQCAAVYLNEKTDVAFRPFGLDLFDKLVKACKAVRTKLENEQKTLASNDLSTLQTIIPGETAVAKLLSNISSLTDPESVRTLARVSTEEESQFILLEKSLQDLLANDPQKLIQQLTLRSGRVQAIAKHLKEMEAALSNQSITTVFEARTKGRSISEKARILRETTFSSDMLPGTGSEQWKVFWEAARLFSQEQCYQGLSFPFVENGAHCVLCQQTINQATANRLMQFEKFVTTTVEKELQKTRKEFAQLRKNFTDLKLVPETVEETLKEIHDENKTVANLITTALTINENRLKAIILALTEDQDLATDCPELVSIAHEADAMVEQINLRISTLSKSTSEETRKKITAERMELKARKQLAAHEQTVLDEIERKKKVAAYNLCMEETNTQAITKKNTTITKTVVSKQLKQSFKNELSNLAFRHAEVELKEVGGAGGVLYHKLILTQAPSINLPKVMSEGEQRCLSIAAFFAELSTANDLSGIVFDDPISSLDYKWREGIARRLVQEAKNRQVIVFTHDIVFLLLLKQYAEELGVNQLDQHVQHLSKGAGVCTEELPWVALSVKKKIGYLNNQWQAVEKLFREGHQNIYEKEAKYLYGMLRETWERAVEEVLLGGVVERYRPGVQTQQIKKIADITPDDCQTLDTAMTKCSKWLPGHDQAAGARAPVPEPAELKEDIKLLDTWVSNIRRRRN